VKSSLEGVAGIKTVEAVHYNLIIQRGGKVLTPDIYFYGHLLNGSTYEAVGDSKLFVRAHAFFICCITSLYITSLIFDYRPEVTLVRLKHR